MLGASCTNPVPFYADLNHGVLYICNGGQWTSPSSTGASLPTCVTNQLPYYSTGGATANCLTLGANLSITSGTLNAVSPGSFAWSAITAGANPNVLTMGTGGSLEYSLGKIDANYMAGYVIPSLTAGLYSWNGSAWAFTTNATTATDLATYPTLCSGGQFSQGLSHGTNNCGSPAGASIFSSWKFGSQTALTASLLYLQLTYPAIFTTAQSGSGTSGSPYVDALGLATETANYGWFGPVSGAAATPTFRPAVPLDVPTINTISAAQAGILSTNTNGQNATAFAACSSEWILLPDNTTIGSDPFTFANPNCGLVFGQGSTLKFTASQTGILITSTAANNSIVCAHGMMTGCTIDANGANSEQYMVKTTNVGITVKGMTFINSSPGTPTSCTPITSCAVTNGVKVFGGSGDIENNTFTLTGQAILVDPESSLTNRTTIKNNFISGSVTLGIQVWNGNGVEGRLNQNGSCEISGNYVENQGDIITNDTGGDGNAIVTYLADGCVITNNKTYNTAYSGFRNDSGNYVTVANNNFQWCGETCVYNGEFGGIGTQNRLEQHRARPTVLHRSAKCEQWIDARAKSHRK